MSYVIVKYVKLPNSTNEVPVIIIDELGEVLTFGAIEDATDYRDLFQRNSDSGHRYVVKHVNDEL